MVALGQAHVSSSRYQCSGEGPPACTVMVLPLGMRQWRQLCPWRPTHVPLLSPSMCASRRRRAVSPRSCCRPLLSCPIPPVLGHFCSVPWCAIRGLRAGRRVARESTCIGRRDAVARRLPSVARCTCRASRLSSWRCLRLTRSSSSVDGGCSRSDAHTRRLSWGCGARYSDSLSLYVSRGAVLGCMQRHRLQPTRVLWRWHCLS